MAGKLKDLYVKRNQNQYQPAADSWEARAAELSNVSEGAMPQGETAGNGVFGWLKDSADAGFFSTLGGTARLAGEFMPFGNDTFNSWADKADEIARRNSPQPGQNLEGADYIASAVGNALGSGGASALEAGIVAGLGSLLGVGGVAGAALGGASKVIPGVGKAVQAGKTLWGSPMGKYLVANVAGSPFEAASESGNLISDMRKENQQGTANYTDDEIRDAALRSGALNLAWLTGMNMLEAGTLGKITGALGGNMAAKGVKDIAKRATLGGLSSGIGEGAEEYGQNLIGDYSKRGNTADFNYDEALEAAKLGAIGGGVLGGLGSGLSATFSKNNSDVAEEIASEDGGTIEEAPEATVSGKEAFINAIAGQESGGNYNAENGDTGAYGKYQIIPSNWPSWAEEAGIGADAPRTPENQEIVARFKLGQYYDKYGARGAAIAWYGGEGALNYSEEALNRKQGDNGEYPSINEYADEVLGRMGNVADSVRIDDTIDDTEENYFDESNYTDDTIPDSLNPVRGFDVSHLDKGTAQDRNSLLYGERVKKAKPAPASEEVASFNQSLDSSNAQKAPNSLFANSRRSWDAAERIYKARAKEQAERKARAQAIVNIANAQQQSFLNVLRNRAAQQWDNAEQEYKDRKQAKLQSLANVINARAAQKWDAKEADNVQKAKAEQEKQAQLQNIARLLDARAAQQWDNAERDANLKQNQAQALANLLNAKAAGQYDVAQQVYANRAKEQAEKQRQQQAIANIINARAAKKFDEAETADKFKFVPQRQSMYDGAMRRNLAALDKVKPEEQPSVEPTERNGRALDERNFREITLPKVREQHKWDKEYKEYHAERYGESALPQTQLLSTDRAARRNMPKPGIEARSFINDRAETKSARERMQDAIAFVWKDDPKHPLKACRRQLNMFRDMRKEYLQPIYDVMAEGAGNGVSRIPIIEFDNQHRGRFYRQSNNSPWYAKYFKEHKKKPTQKAMYDIAEEVAFGENADVGYYAGVQGKELEAIVAENHAQLDPINDYIQTYESLELRLKENPNYGKEQAERINKTEETRRAEKRNAGKTASTESIKTEAKQPAESNQDEVKEAAEQPTKKSFFSKRNEQAEKEQGAQSKVETEQGEKLNLPKGTTVDVSIVGDNSNIIQVKFNGAQGKGTGGIMGRAGYKWKSDKQVWQARKTEKALGVAEQLGYTEEAKPQERDYELEYDELWDTFATKLGIDNILSVDKANEELKGVEGLHDGAIVYSDNNNKLYHIISKESDPEMLKLGYNYDVSTFDIHHIPISIASVKTADEVIKRVTGRSEQKAEPKAKASADTFSKNPDALFNTNALAGAPKQVTDIIQKMPKAEQSKTAKKQTVEKQTQKVREPAKRFDGERARKSLDALIGRKKKSEPQKNDVVPKSKFMNVFNEDELDAEIEKAKKEMSKLSANPMFNPALMKSLFKIGGIYLQKGVNKFAAWADNMVDVMGEKVRPFLPAVWDSLKKYPDNQKFNDDVMTAVMEYVGEGVDNGKSLSAIKREFADDYGDEYLGYVDAAFEGVKKYPTSDNVADVVESKQDNTEGGKENGTDGQTIQTGDSSGSGAVRRGVSSTGKAVHAGGRGSERSDSLLGREPSEDGGTSEETGNSSRVRDREHNQSGRPVGKESEFGNVHNGRKGERSAEQTDVAGSVGRRSRGTDGGRTGVTTNYHIEDPDALIGGTPKVRFLRNKKAIEVVQELLDNERPATKEERDAMAAYIGWGSFGQELFQGTWEKPIYKDGWKEENDWVRDTLGKDAWEEAQNSIINAHYTDPYTINSMWKMAKNMGFKGGKVLEPSMGVGNFFGLMPEDIAEKSQLTGIELDRTTGRMAQALYPQANIQIKGYEESRTPDNFYDMIIGNVPFGNFAIADRRYGKLKPLIHDFFFLKGIDQLKPGGVMMAITTKGTLDKADARVRMEIAKKADLVAAYRLPTGAFDKYAGTNVVTDILIFKKLDKPRIGVRELEWVNSSKYQTTFRGQQETYYYNDYFKNHPENVLGIMEFGHGTTTGRPGLTVKRLDDFGERLKEISNEVPKNIFEADKAQDNIQYISNHKGGEQGSVTTENGKLYTVYGDQLKPLADTKKYSVKSDKQTAQRIQEINDWIKLRDTLGALYDAERTDAANMEELRAELNKVFDDYCAKYVKQGKWERKGKDEQPPFRQSYVNKYMKSIEEPSAARVMALVDDDGNKTAIFSKRSVRGSNTDIKNPTISQALIMQRNENVSNLDIDRIAELAKKSKADVISELTKSGTIFKTPAGNYEVKDMYLSGNVRQKLREAEDALQSGDKDMQANIEALKKVIPETVPYYNISTSMGATWIPQDVYRQFIAHLLSVDSIDNIKLTRTKGYSVELGKGYNNLNAATTVYGLSEIPFSKLLTHAFNHTKPVITMRKSGEVVEDTEAMNKANDKLEKIYDEFNDWLWKDNSRKLQLEHEYNEIMNAIAVPTYDGSFMDMPGMALLRGNSQFNLRQHQLNAIYRGLINGSGVYAHEVGTGKTYTMAGLAVESRRYGLAKKPLLLAFNANSASVAKEINDMYPGAKVLYIDNLDRKNIKLKLEQIRTDDWDCVVMPHSLVDKLSFKEDTLMAMAEQQIYELEQAAIEAAEQDGEKISVEQMEKMRTAGKDEKVKGVRSTTAKKLVTMRNKIINQIKQSALNASAEDAISFEDLGIDMVLVDEAHAFKKPPFATTRKIKGLTTESSNRSIQLSFITQYIQSINNGRGVHLFTGTPITNTLTEMYHMMRYVMPKAMEDAGIKDFDSWMNSFAEETADMEFTSTGDVEMVSRLASFTNVPELRRFVGQYWDTVFADDMPEFKPRETASGKTITDKLTDEEQDELLNGYTEEPQGRPYKKVIVETLKLTNSQNTILNDLVKKAKRYKNATKQERKEIARQEFHATPLLISNDASLAGMDPRLYDININTQGEETKIDRCVSNVAKIYKEGTDAHPTVQVIFTDVGYSDTKTRSIPQRTGLGKGDFKSVKETVPTFNMAKALVKQLTEQGIPENEIVVMKASYSPEKRAQIADMLKTGKYRVVIGSTATLGVGVNMQDNLRAMHHLDCPWMPGDLTQRNGRGHRQGNHWNTVLEYRYVTEKLDTKRWQTVLRKDAFINSFMKSKVGDNSVRAFEMGADDMNDKDTDSDLLQTLSEASGDPRVLIQKKYETNLAKLERKERTFIAGIEDIKGRLKYIDSVIEHKKDEWKALSADAETFVANKKADFEIKLVSSLKVGASRKLVTFDNRTDAQKHLGDILKQVMDIGVDNRIGEYTGFEVVVRKEASSIDGTYQPVIRLNGETTHLCGTPSIGGIASKAANIPGRVGKAQTAYEQAKKDKTELQKAAQETFPQQEQLDKTRKQLEEVKQDRMLSPTPPPEWLVNGVTLSSTFYVDDKPYSLSGYRANSDGYYLVGEANGEQRVFPFQDATDIQGMKVYDMTNHVPSPAYKAPSAEDIKNATANNTQYSVSSDAVQRAKEEVEAEIRAAFPNGKVEYVNGAPTITMPNGSKFQYSIRENIVVNAKEQRKADAAHGTSGARVQGFWKKFTGNGVQRMLAVSQNSERGTAFHEAMHAAIDLVLTEKEKNALYNYYEKKAKEQNRDVDEVIADAYRDWVLARQRKSGTMFGKLWRKVKDFCTRIKAIFDKGAEVERIMQNIESGRVYERGTNNHSAKAKISASAENIYSDTESINPNEDYIQGINDTDAAKVNTLAKSFEDKGYVGRPVVLVENGNEGYIAVTGSHRIEAAKQADVDLKAIVLENNEDTAQLIEARDDDDRANIAKELYEKGVISKSAYDVIREEADNNYTYYSVASPKHKIANAFTNTERKGVVDSAKDFFKEHRKSLYQDWFDKNNPLKGFDALTKATGGLSVYDQVQSLPATTAGMLKALTEGTAQHVKMANQHLKNVKMKYNVTLAMALEKIDKKSMDKAYPKYLAENGFDNWVNALGAYLGAERCLEMARLARAEGKTYKFPKGLTEQECQAFVNKAPQQFKAAADIFYKVNDNVISIMEDAEVFSHDLAKTLRTKYRKYCPLLRDFSDTAAADSFIGGLTEGGRGIGNVSVPLKRINIEGSERGVLNPLETILKSYAVMLNRAERNKVALMAVENSRTADLHELIQEVPGTTADPKNCVFTVLINGKKKAYKTTQDLYGPIVGYNLPAANLAFGVARTAARMLRTGATMSPSFILRNVLRDTVFAGIASKNGFIPLVDTIRGAISLAKDPAMRAEFEAAGVTEYNFYSSQKSRIKSLDAMAGETPASAWEIMKAVFSRLEATSDFFESSTRMGEYMKARQKGLSMEEAARAAREVTLDFSRSGRIGEQVNQVVPFFNACLQGGDKMVRLFRENPWGTAMKVTGYIILPSLLLLAMNWDEDWYKDLDPDIKNNYWCLGRNIRIPKPQEAGVLFGSGIEALFQQAAEKDKDAVSNFLKAFISNVIPSVLPTLILPLIEWSANYSFFKGRPIVGNKYSRLPDELQYNDYTSELSKGIGSTFKISPMKFDNLVRGYTGTMGALLWSMAGEPFAKANNLPAKHFSELPFVRDFNVTDANLSRPMNEFYGILDKANRQHAGYGVKGKPEAAVKGIRSAGAMISRIRKDIDKITHSNLTPERKRELIDKRKEKMNQIAKQATARYGKYFE